jgi:hypothetical protein
MSSRSTRAVQDDVIGQVAKLIEGDRWREHGDRLPWVL